MSRPFLKRIFLLLIIGIVFLGVACFALSTQRNDFSVFMYQKKLFEQQKAIEDWHSFSPTAKLLESFGISTKTTVNNNGE